MKKSIRKVLAPAALAAVLLTTGCTTGTINTPAKPLPDISSPASTPAPSSAASTPAPVETPLADAGKAPAATGDAASEVAVAKATIDTITVKGRAPKTGYSRDQFGAAWADVDKNGCDTRNDILKRDLTDITFKDGTKQCVLATGKLADKYTGKTIDWKRGQDTSSAIQVDHIIPLSLSWQQGAQQWTADKRKQFANDPINLNAADGPTNGSKSDSGPGSWLPPNKAYRCEYIAEFVAVAKKYELSMNQGDFDASKSILATC